MKKIKNIDIQNIKKSNIGLNFLSFIYDFIIVILPLYFFIDYMFFYYLNDISSIKNLNLYTYLFILFNYFVLTLKIFQKTIGDFLANIKLIEQNKDNITWEGVIIRISSFVIIFMSFGLVLLYRFFNKKKEGFLDMVSETFYIRLN